MVLRFLMAVAALGILASCAAPAAVSTMTQATAVPLSAVIDLSDQEITVTHRSADGATEVYRWPVSTARPGYVTPIGTFHPQWLSRYHRSSLYDDAPMPWSVFFYNGVAIHGTTEVQDLGRPVSHGCVRLHPTHAQAFFNMVLEVGKDQTRITVRP